MGHEKKIKLYFFECGTLKSQKQYFTLNKDIGMPFEVPVPFFLIKHPKRNILFDLGNSLFVAENPEKHWGDVVNAYYPVMKKEQYVVNQLKKIGINPEDINYVILSHLHLDHAGGVGDFPNAVYVVQQKEYDWAYSPENNQKDAYIKADFDKPVKWKKLNGEETYDFFGDGTLEIWFTPGHTPGHQSLMVNLENSGKFFLTADSCYTDENLNENILPGLVWDAELSMNVLKKLQEMQKDSNITIITGHDPLAWGNYKQAPEFYD